MASSATTSRPSKIRSTATDESTALKRRAGQPGGGEEAHQLAGPEGQDVVGHEADRDGVPQRRGGERSTVVATQQQAPANRRGADT